MAGKPGRSGAVGKTMEKKSFPELFKLNRGNAGKTCDALGLCRRTFYDWMKKDPEFKETILDIREMTIDTVEEALIDQVEKGNIAAIIFFLKCRAKDRGYVERSEVNVSNTHVVKHDWNLEDLTDAELLTLQEINDARIERKRLRGSLPDEGRNPQGLIEA